MQKLVLFSLLLILTPLDSFAVSADDQGLLIAREGYLRDTGFGNFRSDLTMTLVNRTGKKTTRQLHRITQEVNGDGDKDLIVFDAPGDIKGTAALIHTHTSKLDDQWLWLPAVNRVKRISSANKSGPFVGSEFAFEDIARAEVEKYSYKFLREEAINDKNSFVLELTPTYEHSGYTRLVQWLDKSTYQPLKVVFYDRKDTLLKTLKFRNYQQYLDKFWRASEMIMENHQSGKKTILDWENYQFDVGLSERDFSVSSLKRAR